MKKLLVFILFLLFFFNSKITTFAVTDPLSVPNNRFGIHIQSENSLENAAKLVNSEDGDWGYVTFVITEGERDHDRWQKVFDRMRRLHLIPIVRIATKANGDMWEKPKNEEINNWIAFLNSLNWVIENRYIIIGNEPNLGLEWGGKSNAFEYAAYLKSFSQKLKEASRDFFVLPAGLAPTVTEEKFLKDILKKEPDFTRFIDGWTSHPYPTKSITLYNRELNILGANLPVFITETGWSNKEFSESLIGERLTSAFTGPWNNPKIVAVTPFILDYPNPPFDEFSWQKADGTFYSYYKSVQQIEKTKGVPVQLESGTIVAAFAQPVIPLGSDYIGALTVKNLGQSIWNSNINLIKGDNSSVEYKSIAFGNIEPMNLGLIIFKSVSPQATGVYSQSLFLTGDKGQRITNSFPIDAYVTKIDWSKIRDFFAKILSKGR